MTAFEPLATPRLALRRFELTDAERVQRLAGDWRVARFTARIPYPYPDGAAQAWIAETHKQIAAGSGYTVAITFRGEETLVGSIGLERDDADQAAELGYWVAVDEWGKGIATEAARRMVEFGFGPMALEEIRAHVIALNAGSRRVLEKLGMTYQGPATIEARGRNVEVETFALAREHWEAR